MLRLQAINPYRRLSHLPASPRLLDAATRQQLCRDLTLLGDLAVRLRRVRANGQNLPAGAAADYETLLSLLHLDVPSCVRRLEPGWFEELRQRIEADRRLLDIDGAAQRAPQTLPDIEARLLGKESRFRVWPAELPEPSPLFTRNAERYRRLEAADGSELPWAGLAAWLRDCFAPRRVPNTRILEVQLEHKRRERKFQDEAIAEVSIRQWYCPQPLRGGVWLRMQLAMGKRICDVIQATLALTTDSADRHRTTSTRQLRADTERLAKALRPGDRYGPLLLAALGGMRMLLRQPKDRPLQEVLQDVLAQASDRPAASGLRLLAELASHKHRLASLPRRKKKQLVRALPAVIEETDWADVLRCATDAFSSLRTGQQGELRELLGALADACPHQPTLEEIEFLFNAATALGINLGPVGPVLQTVLAACRCRRRQDLSDVLEQLQIVFRQGAKCLGEVTIRRLLDFLTGHFQQLQLDELAPAIGDLAPPLRALLAAGAHAGDVASRLKGVAARLLDFLPARVPGTWQLTESHRLFLQAINEFCQLLAALRAANRGRPVGDWQPAALRAATDWLPRELASGSVAACPDSYWPLVAAWLQSDSSAQPSTAPYCMDVAQWFVANYLALDTDQLRTALAGRLAELGSWLRQQAVAPRLYEQLATDLTQQVLYRGARPERAAEALPAFGSLNSSDRTLARKVQQALLAAFELAPWPNGLQHGFCSWMAAVAAGDSEPLAALATPALEGLVRCDGNQFPHWRTLIEHCPSPHSVPDQTWDNILDRLGQLAATEFSETGAMTLAGQKLRELAIWSGQREGWESMQRWLESLHQVQASGEPLLGPAEEFELLLAGLRRRPAATAATLERHWPRLPARLLLHCPAELAQEFVQLCRLTGLTLKPAHAHLLALELHSLLLTAPVRIASSEQRALAVIQAWASALGWGSTGPGPLIKLLWPGLPARLVCNSTADTLLSQYQQACRQSEVTVSEAMELALAGEVLARLSDRPPAASAACQRLDRLALLFAHNGVHSLWQRVTEMVSACSQVPATIVLALGYSLFCSPRPARQQAFRSEAWRLATELRSTDRDLAGHLAHLGLGR